MPFITLNNHQFFFYESGVEYEDKAPILFIHGLGSSTLDWKYQLDFFDKSYKVFSIDLRGHGQTKSTSEAYTVSLFVEDIAAFLRQRNQPTHIIALSMGGMIAFQLAVSHPTLVKSMVIINSLAELPMDNPKVRKGIRMRKIIPRILGMKRMGKFIGKKLFPNKEQAHLRNLVAQRWAKNSVKDYIKSVNAIAGWTIKNRLHEIKCPVLVIGGANDYSTEFEKKAYTDLIPYASLSIVPNTGHALPIENPTALNKLILSFLKTV